MSTLVMDELDYHSVNGFDRECLSKCGLIFCANDQRFVCNDCCLVARRSGIDMLTLIYRINTARRELEHELERAS